MMRRARLVLSPLAMKSAKEKRHYPRGRKKAPKDESWKQRVDLKFLEWLEGSADRVPRMNKIRDLDGEDLVTSVRAATWLRQFCAQRERIAPLSAEKWDERYSVLVSFLGL